MKGIIYTDFNQAEIDCNACNVLPQGQTEQEGGGEHADPRPNPPYTFIIKKWDEDLWAVIADTAVEVFLNKTAIEIPNTWFKPSVTPGVQL
jgi:hypothetical protein